MKIVASDLKTALACVQQAVMKGTNAVGNLSTMDNIWFFGERIGSFNGGMFITVPFDTGKVAGVGVRSKELGGVLGKAKDGEIDLSYEDGEVRFSSRKFRSGVKASSLPGLLAEFEVPTEWTEIPEGFGNGVMACQSVTSPNNIHFQLGCIAFIGSHMLATDRVRLALCDIATPISEEIVLLWAEDLKFPSAPIEYNVDDAWVHFRCEEEVIFSVRRREGDYFPMATFTSMSNTEHSVGIPIPDGLTEAVSQALVFENKNNQVGFRIEPGKLVISSMNEIGWLEREVDVDYDGDKFDIYVTPSVLANQLDFVEEMHVLANRVILKGDGVTLVIAAKARETVVEVPTEEEEG